MTDDSHMVAARADFSVLVVDDNPGDLLLAAHVLRASRFVQQVLEARSADEALDLFRSAEQSPPSLVFLDMAMPRKSGADFLVDFAELRERRGYDETFVVILSSAGGVEERPPRTDYPFVIDSLDKPLRTADLQRLGDLLQSLRKDEAR